MLWPLALGAPRQFRNFIVPGGGTVGDHANTQITLGTTAYATPTQVIASTPYDTGFIGIRTSAQSYLTGARRDALYKVMVGGSGSETDLIGPVTFGQAPSGATMLLPCRVPAGSRLSITGKGTGATSMFMSVNLFEAHPLGVYPSRWVSNASMGLVDDASNSRGTIVAPGASSTWGSWVSLGTLDTACDWWVPMWAGGTQTTMNAYTHRLQFAIGGTGDPATMATNGTLLGEMLGGTTTLESVYANDYPANNNIRGQVHGFPAYCPVDLGTSPQAWVRAMSSAATPDTDALSAAIMGAIF